MPNFKEYDVVIVGSGPAGISAAIYSKRFALRTLIVGESYGGAIARTHIIENYPGFASISGYDLMEAWRGNIENLNIELIDDYVDSIERTENGTFKVSMEFEGEVITNSVIYCLGREERKLGVPGEEKFHGRGVSYCATCDGPFFKQKVVGVIGGSDSAAKEALYLSNLASKVYIIYRGEQIHPEPINLERINNCSNVEIINKSNVVEIYGNNLVEGVKLDTGRTVELDAVFVEIGADPRVELVKPLNINLNEKNEIIADEQMKTNVKGLFAAGDVVNRREKQVVVAAGHGVIAAFSARDYVENECQKFCKHDES